MIGIGIGIGILVFDFLLFWKTKWFMPVFIVAGSIAWGQIWIDFFIEGQKQKEIESRFLDFVRNLTGAIKSGMPVPKAIMHVANIDYGSLSPYIRKMGNQVEWSVPIHKSLLFFSNSTRNDIIKRSISTVIEAEQSGGNMEDVLESITQSLLEIKKIKESRRASIHSQVVQSYIIFFVFVGVMVVIQNLLIPYLLGQSQGGGALGGAFGGGAEVTVNFNVEIKTDSLGSFIVSMSNWFTSLRGVFLMLSLIQGLFAGVIIGKLSEGDLTSGLKHSLILCTIAFFVMTLISPPTGPVL